jgi:hypothetical protein
LIKLFLKFHEIETQDGGRVSDLFQRERLLQIIESLKKINDIGLNAPDPIFAAQKEDLAWW